MLPPLSKRQKAVLSVSLALLLLAPSVLATHDQHTLVTGHTTFYNGAKYDECMASVAGIVRSQVMWFNDMVLAERYAGKGTYIYVTEAGADDPRYNQNKQLYSEGVTYTFTDPNGIPWTVQEAFWWTNSHHVKVESTGGGAPTTGNGGNPQNGDGVEADVEQSTGVTANVLTNRTYVWIVELSAVPIYDMFAGQDPENAHTYYNFVTLIDTCKMRANATQPPVEGDPDHWNVTHDTPEELNKEHGHRNGAPAHTHEAKMADIWIGKATHVVPIVGFQTADGATWESKWAQGEAGNTQEEAGFEPTPPTS